MLDAMELPILLKAIDFVFEEGRKILAERRERRMAKDASAPAEAKPAEAEPAVPAALSESKGAMEAKEESKQELLTVKVDESLWRNYEVEVQHLMRLLETYSRNYQIAKEQYAKWGSALVPPIIVHNLTEAEDAMVETIKQLEAVLSKVYKKDIQVVK
ncbi:MAG TPA: hypothetical protein PKK96_06395 [Anaerolineales bacterium]|nr:hypothetical protein [Anaerolineales bacterium]HNQ94254.1 hypothetical protein [Anaerolineales bacterium]HNS60616.1 hypothetical protein [Anaerolineales bacterium]